MKFTGNGFRVLVGERRVMALVEERLLTRQEVVSLVAALASAQSGITGEGCYTILMEAQALARTSSYKRPRLAQQQRSADRKREQRRLESAYRVERERLGVDTAIARAAAKCGWTIEAAAKALGFSRDGKL
jgi:hypothetical protein